MKRVLIGGLASLFAAGSALAAPVPTRFEATTGLWAEVPGTLVDEIEFAPIDPRETNFDETLGFDAVFDVAGEEFGARIDFSAMGRFGLLFLMHEMDAGTVDIDVPVGVSLALPEYGTYGGGDTVAIGTSVQVHSAAGFLQRSPRPELLLDVAAIIEVGVTGDVCIFGCTGGSLDLFTIGQDFGFTLRESTNCPTPQSAPAGCSPPPRLLTPGGTCEVFEIDLLTESFIDPFDQVDSRFRLPYCFNGPETAILGLEGWVDLPHNPNARGELQPDGTVYADSFYPFLKDFSWDILTLVNLPLTESFSFLGATLAWNAGSLGLGLEATQDQETDFAALAEITVDFPEPLAWSATDTGVAGPMVVGPQAVFPPGFDLYVTLPTTGSAVVFQPRMQLVEGHLDSIAGQSYAPNVHPTFGSIRFVIPPIEVIPEICVPLVGCTPEVSFDGLDISLGPLIDFTFELGDLELELADLDFNVPFDANELPPITLPLEKPRMQLSHELSRMENLGAGLRRYTFTNRVRNLGDVTLTDLQIDHDLLTPLGFALSITVESVDGTLTPNPSYDGDADVGMVATGAVLLPGEEAFMVTRVLVEPGPSPLGTMAPWSADHAVMATAFSPQDSLIDASRSSRTSLGPMGGQTLNDVALFGDKEVTIISADVTGLVLGNEVVELRGAGVLAGDVRAKERLYVPGDWTLDYGFAGRTRVTGSPVVTGYVNDRVRLPRVGMPPMGISPGTTAVDVLAGETVELTTGDYGRVRVLGTGTLVLSAGFYQLAELDVRNGAQVVLDDSLGPIIVLVGDVLSFGHDVAMTEPRRTEDVWWSVAGDELVRIGRSSHFFGTLYAPLNNVLVDEGATVQGSIQAAKVLVLADVMASGHVKPPGPLYMEYDSDGDGFAGP